MNAIRKFHPDLHACELEDRILPVITNLGVIVLTNGGFVLTTPFPGVEGSPGGTVIPTSFSITGSGGIFLMQPGIIPGISALATTATSTSGSSGSVSATNANGSGASDATAVSTPLVTRNTIANDSLVPLPQIGQPSGDESPVLPVGQFYRDGLGVTVPARPSSEAAGEQPSRWSPRQRPVDPTTIRLTGTPPGARSDVSGPSMKPLANRMP
jgi:hypothetical protein